MSDSIFAAPIGANRAKSGKLARRQMRTGIIVVSVILLALIAAPLVWRVVAQGNAERALQLNGPNAIQESAFVPINGTEQWVTIRGEDRRNPVLVILPDGPGDSSTAFAQRYRHWEQYFTIVQWDPPGAGRTAGRHGDRPQTDYSADELARDGQAVVAHALSRTGQRRAGLMASGFGSLIGIRMVRANPESFYGYVGVGQIVAGPVARDQALYQEINRLAQSTGDASAQAHIAQVGAPPWTGERREAADGLVSGYFDTQRADPTETFSTLATAPGWSLGDVMAFYRAREASAERLDTESADFAPTALAPRLEAPVLLITGTLDGTAPAPLADAWFEQLQAPLKRAVPQPRYSHDILITHNSVVEALVVQIVRPWAAQPGSAAPARPRIG